MLLLKAIGKGLSTGLDRQKLAQKALQDSMNNPFVFSYDYEEGDARKIAYNPAVPFVEVLSSVRSAWSKAMSASKTEISTEIDREEDDYYSGLFLAIFSLKHQYPGVVATIRATRKMFE